MHGSATPSVEEREMDEPIDIGDVFRWHLGGSVLVRNMFIDEDGNTQVRVTDRGDNRSVDAETLFKLVSGGGLKRHGTVDEFDSEPWAEPRAV